MHTMLTQEDSKRVADALISKIRESDFDIANAVYEAVHSSVRSVLMPRTRNNWVDDWFPLTIEEMCNEISRGVIDAAYSAARKE